MKAFAIDRTQRYTSCASFVRALREAPSYAGLEMREAIKNQDLKKLRDLIRTFMITKRRREEFECLQELVKHDDSYAWYRLGDWYRKGDTEYPGDEVKARECYWRAYQLGEKSSLKYLGMLELHGKPVYFAEAIRMAEKGDVKAQYEIARLYQMGVNKSSAEDLRQALKWFTLAARQFHPQALLQLGTMYIIGEEVKADPVKGERLLTLAGEQGVATAWLGLGAMYQDGVYVQANKEKASYFFRLAEELDPGITARNTTQDWLAIVNHPHAIYVTNQQLLRILTSK